MLMYSTDICKDMWIFHCNVNETNRFKNSILLLDCNSDFRTFHLDQMYHFPELVDEIEKEKKEEDKAWMTPNSEKVPKNEEDI